jgi:hypothetical protein
MQCFGSGLDSIRSVDPYLDPDSIRSVDPYLDPDSESESGFRRAKTTHRSRKIFRNFMF